MTRPTYDLPSNLPATPSPTQGEKPAAARALARRIIGIVDNLREKVTTVEVIDAVAAALSSPQEGATAVGADIDWEAMDELCAIASKSLYPVPDRGPEHPYNVLRRAVEAKYRAAARIEALQRQVAFYQERNNTNVAALRNEFDRAEAAEASLRTLGDRHAATERDACMWAERYSALQSAHEEQHQRRLAQEEKIDTLGDALERAREALGRIAGKNNLEGVPDDDVQSAACNALYECELIAREALEDTPPTREPATPSSPSDKGADE